MDLTGEEREAFERGMGRLAQGERLTGTWLDEHGLQDPLATHWVLYRAGENYVLETRVDVLVVGGGPEEYERRSAVWTQEQLRNAVAHDRSVRLLLGLSSHR